ncbi:hypothetical protein ABW21_db0200582 [Orbilia brochopaga]|nr:hypothetical protein ABW21_db0200582 [Drechslerella brochopaga]
MSTDPLILPLTYQAQQRLEQTKAEIITLHGKEFYNFDVNVPLTHVLESETVVEKRITEAEGPQPEVKPHLSETLERRLKQMDVESLNLSAILANGNARDARDTLRPLWIVDVDDPKLPFRTPDNFPRRLEFLMKLKLKENASRLWELLKFYNVEVYREAIDIDDDDILIDLPSLQEIQANLDDCFYEFVRYIGVKQKVIDKIIEP